MSRFTAQAESRATVYPATFLADLEERLQTARNGVMNRGKILPARPAQIKLTALDGERGSTTKDTKDTK